MDEWGWEHLQRWIDLRPELDRRFADALLGAWRDGDAALLVAQRAPGMTRRRGITPYRDGPLLIRGPFMIRRPGRQPDRAAPRDGRAVPLRSLAPAAVLRRRAQGRRLSGAEQPQAA